MVWGAGVCVAPGNRGIAFTKGCGQQYQIYYYDLGAVVGLLSVEALRFFCLPPCLRTCHDMFEHACSNMA